MLKPIKIAKVDYKHSKIVTVVDNCGNNSLNSLYDGEKKNIFIHYLLTIFWENGRIFIQNRTFKFYFFS